MINFKYGRDPLHTVLMIIMLISILLVSGCSTLQRIDPDIRNVSLTPVKEVNYVATEYPKPVPTYEGNNAILTPPEFSKLLTLVKGHKATVQDFNQLIEASRKQSRLHNKMLEYIEVEQARANKYSVMLSEERNARIHEQRVANVEKAGIGIGLLLLLLLL